MAGGSELTCHDTIHVNPLLTCHDTIRAVDLVPVSVTFLGSFRAPHGFSGHRTGQARPAGVRRSFSGRRAGRCHGLLEDDVDGDHRPIARNRWRATDRAIYTGDGHPNQCHGGPNRCCTVGLWRPCPPSPFAPRF